MVLATTTLTDTVDNVAVKGVSEGIAYILVKDSKGNLVTTLPISIVAKRVPTTLELDKTSVEISVKHADGSTIDVTSGSAAATEAAVTLAIDSGSAVRKDGKVGVYTVGL